MIEWLGRLLGIEQLDTVHSLHVRFAAPWAANRPALVLFGGVALAVLGVLFYFRYQALGRRLPRAALPALRSALLLLLLVLLVCLPVLAADAAAPAAAPGALRRHRQHEHQGQALR